MKGLSKYWLSNTRSIIYWLVALWGFFAVFLLVFYLVIPFQELVLGTINNFFEVEFPVHLNFLVVFIFMVIGNATSVPVGIPTVYIVAKKVAHDAWFWPNLGIIAVAAGFGAAIGEVIGYLIGRGAGEALRGNETVRNMEYLVNLLTKRRSISWLVIYLFGLTPLPDQILMVPLGIANYPYKKVFLPCSLGKASFSFLIAIGASLFGFVGGEGVTVDNISQELFGLIVILSLLVVLSKVNWEYIIEFHSAKKRKTPIVLSEEQRAPEVSHDEEQQGISDGADPDLLDLDP